MKKPTPSVGVCYDTAVLMGAVRWPRQSTCLGDAQKGTLTMSMQGHVGVNWARRAILAALGSVAAGGVFHRALAAEVETSTTIGEQMAAHEQGQRKLTYSLNAAEAWVADFGAGKLQSGRARIDLGSDFLEVANSALPYRILVTPNGRTAGLYVAQRDATGFTVEEQAGGNGAVEFDYQVVAKQRGFEDQRLEVFTPPSKPQVPTEPSLPQPPPQPPLPVSP